MSFQVLYHHEVKDDISQLNARLKTRVKNAIETRLLTAPQKYGEPLRKTLKGYWKMRVGDYRIVFKVAGNQIIVFGIIHRKSVYEEIGKRF
ncbi:MAG: type II toxin-antitoxin system RelE/ParE family toxin [Nitrospinae bacterium]|nr:type II toxin-antitoxin system RelE/ParE family toxin [Nitrospinota bacterium]